MLYSIVKKNQYRDSLACLYAMALIVDQEGVEKAYVSMATASAKDTFEELGLATDEIRAASDGDYCIAAEADSKEAFDAAVALCEQDEHKSEGTEHYRTVSDAVKAHPAANLCQISVPGEYAYEVTKDALMHDMHCIVFSANVPLDQERKMKELARERGLLCMGPDCGVANINGAAFVLSSITGRGPFGIVGASGCGIQHVASMLHQAGSGVTQTIGTGGKDLTDEVGGITFFMGIDALEADPDTKYLILISHKPGDTVLPRMLDRIKACTKPVIACLLGADCEAEVREAGAVWADSLDACGLAALSLIGKTYPFDTEEQLWEKARAAASQLAPEQKYVRGVFCGGTYCDEAMKTMQARLGGIYSNCPLSEELRLADSMVSVRHTIVDSGEEEFTAGKPHPTLEPSVRLPLIAKEGDDPETAVLLLDLILCPPEVANPAEVTLKGIADARARAAAHGHTLAVVASVLGTDADVQNASVQRKVLEDAGVIVCASNRQAAELAAMIASLQEGKA